MERLSVLSSVKAELVVERRGRGSLGKRYFHFPPTPRWSIKKGAASTCCLELAYFPSFGIESHQELMSQSNESLSALPGRQTLAEGAEVRIMTADASSHYEENFPDGASSSTYGAFTFHLTAIAGERGQAGKFEIRLLDSVPISGISAISLATVRSATP